MAGAVDDFEALGGELEGDFAGFAGFQVDALESCEVEFVGGDAGVFLLEIELGHLVAGDVAGVGEGAGNGEFAVCGDGRGGQHGVLIVKVSIAESEAEGIERALRHAVAEAVGIESLALGGVAGGFVGEVERDLAGGFREGDGDFAAGIVIAEKCLGDGGAAGLAGDAGVEDGRDMALDVVEGHGLADEQHGDDGLAGPEQGSDKGVLMAGWIEAGAALGLADGGVRIAEADDDGIGGSRGGDGFFDHGKFSAGWRLGEEFGLRPAGVGDLAAFLMDDFDVTIY